MMKLYSKKSLLREQPRPEIIQYLLNYSKQMRVIKNRTLILIYKISAIMKIVFADRFELNIFDKQYYNIQYFKTAESPSLIHFFNEAASNFAGKSFGADLTVVCLTFFAFLIPESIRLKIKYWWILIPLTFLINSGNNSFSHFNI